MVEDCSTPELTCTPALSRRIGGGGRSESPASRTPLVLLALILAFAAAVRAYSLGQNGFWTDELCSLSEATGHGLQLDAFPVDVPLPPHAPVCTRLADARPITAVVPALAREDTHPPVYFLLLRLWMDVFGDTEAAVRSLDVCVGVAAVGLLYAAAVPDVGPTAALWACLVMAVAGPQVQFAQEARDYMPVVALSLAAVVAARRLPARGAAVGLAACLLLMMLTNYLAAPVAAVVVGYAVGRRDRRRSAVIATAAAAGLFLLLWGWALPSQWRAAGYETAWLTDAAPGHLRRTLLAVAALPLRWVADVPPSPVSALAGVLFLLLPWAWFAAPKLRLWIAWAVVSTLTVAVGDLLHHTTQATLLRYTLTATPGAYVLLAAAGRRVRWAVPAIAVVAGLVALPAAYAPPWKTDFGKYAEQVTRRGTSADGLVVSGPNPITAQMATAAFRHYVPAMPTTAVVLTRPVDVATLIRLRGCPRVWVLWLWPDRSVDAFLPGYVTAEEGPVPPGGRFAVGRVQGR